MYITKTNEQFKYGSTIESWIPSLSLIIVMTEKSELKTTKGGVSNG